ncbi:hypothetical protein L7F22_067643 [Adiantum nelumboides]|nr:hypothetical protein [Adiantum nelumboides]
MGGWAKVFGGCVILLAICRVIADDLTSFKLDQTHIATHNAISDVTDALIMNLGWSKDEVKISHIDTTDSKFGQTLVYEFDIEIGGKMIPLRLTEEVQVWKYLEELPAGSGESLAIKTIPVTLGEPHSQVLAAILAPFQLSGPVELWIQDAEQVRLAVPVRDSVRRRVLCRGLGRAPRALSYLGCVSQNDVEAGVLKKVLLADGAVVTVEGAREISLARPLQLPLPLPGISNDEEKPLLSLKIVGPTSLVASSAKDSETSRNKLKVKRLSPGAIELLSSQQQEDGGLTDFVQNSLSVLSGVQEPWLWPLTSLNGSDARLLNLEKLLLSAMGPSAYRKGSFKLLRAKVSAATFVRVEFQLEKKLSDINFTPDFWPEWRTKPKTERMQFEVLAKIEGQKLLPVKVQAMQPYLNVDTTTWRVLHGNVSHSKVPRIFLPPSSMTLNPNWEGILD